MQCTGCGHIWFQTGATVDEMRFGGVKLRPAGAVEAAPDSKPRWPVLVGAAALLAACILAAVTVVPWIARTPSGDRVAVLAQTSDTLRRTIQDVTPQGGLDSLIMPLDGDLAGLPQDPKNPLTPEKVSLGMLLFHDPSLGLAGKGKASQEWSCASCHHAGAGFKSGVVQGIGEGGVGFGRHGEARLMQSNYDAQTVDVQPMASPTVLNAAFQSVMLWDGKLGNSTGDNANAAIDATGDRLDPPVVAANAKALAGLETQVIVGGGAHRLPTHRDQIVADLPVYGPLFEAAFGPDSNTPVEDVSHAIAAFERTIVANKSPFQKWLRGDEGAMTLQQLRGAQVFFGKAKCAQCHQGPGLSSAPGADPDSIFFAMGFGDMDMNAMVGTVPDSARLGRGAVTGHPADNYKFKIPQLYNLVDANVMGHGGTFRSVRAVVEYKNAAVPQATVPVAALDRRFEPLHLSEAEVTDLVAFLEQALHDPDLDRFVPAALPTGACLVNADPQSRLDLGCDAPQGQKLARNRKDAP